MGFWEAISDLAESVAPWSVAEAEAPATDSKAEDHLDEENKDEPKEQPATEDAEDKSEDKEEESAEEEPEEEEEEEEEEDEEPKDPKDEFEEECKNSKQCAPAKHHYDECVERVTAAQDNGGAKEDCVEEFFHLAHCATQCAAPKLWSVLK
ncbi:hypothetical protein VPNG_04446 [Cytospora leucostoma]|uniref:Cytochrome b-c1 complex subunit 6, mitochondrial n=1 Tax=Cytospora leucostoma TaxID=1230097 RepID=A0A423XBU2_9PEZI|nr:hypothetical protein VPNG_04446 [Cytospora leucostoma]